MKKLLALILALVMCVSLVACGGDKKEDEAGKPAESQKPAENTQAAVTPPSKDAAYEEWVWTVCGTDLPTGDPYGSTMSETQYTTNMTFDTINYVDADTGEIMPELAYKWENSADNLEWTFYLEEGVTFHNGNKFTADDVKFTWEYAGVNQGNVNKTIAAWAYVKEIVVVDDYTVKFVLNSPMPDFATYLETKVYDKESFDTLPAEEAAIIGTGPYYLDVEQITPGAQFVVTRYDNYWKGTDSYPTKHIGFRIIPDKNSQVSALQAGQVDFLFSVPVESYDTVNTTPSLQVITRTGAETWHLGFNYDQEIFHDVEVRRAIAQAINKDDLVAVTYNGGVGGVANDNFCVPTGLGYSESVTTLPYDPDAAKVVLDKVKDKLEGMTLVYYGAGAQMSEVIQSNLADLGVNIKVEPVGPNWAAQKAERAGYDLYICYAAYQGALLYNFNRFFYTGGSSNVCGWQSDEYDALQDKVSAATSWDDMLKEFAVVQQWVIDNVPVFPLGIPNIIAAAQTDVEGLYLAPTTNYHDFSTVRIPERG